jgi:hypothetical protein
MTLNPTNKENPVFTIKQKLERLLRSTDRVQRQVEMIESNGTNQPLISLLRRETWINLKRSWQLFPAVRRLKA